jgi:hypothetical protein
MKSSICTWCKKPIETANHYSVIRTVKGLPFRGKKQVWEFHTLAEVKQWAGHKPVAEDEE